MLCFLMKTISGNLTCQKARSKNLNSKKFTLPSDEVFITPYEVFKPFSEWLDDLSQRSKTYLKLLQRM